MEFGTRIRKLRQAAYRKNPAINIDSLSDHLNISRGQLMKIERGEKQPFDEENIRNFCNYVNRPELIGELLNLAFESKRKLVFELDTANEKQKRVALLLAREWDNPESYIWDDEFYNKRE